MEQQELEQHSDVSLDPEIVFVQRCHLVEEKHLGGEQTEHRSISRDVVVGREDLVVSTPVPVAHIEGLHVIEAFASGELDGVVALTVPMLVHSRWGHLLEDWFGNEGLRRLVRS